MQNADAHALTTTKQTSLFPVTAPTIPPLLTKKWLYNYFQIPQNSGGSYRMRKQVLTDDVLAQVGIALDEYNAIRIFSAVQSRRIKEVLGL